VAATGIGMVPAIFFYIMTAFSHMPNAAIVIARTAHAFRCSVIVNRALNALLARIDFLLAFTHQSFLHRRIVDTAKQLLQTTL
jgi:hypothetical protein